MPGPRYGKSRDHNEPDIIEALNEIEGVTVIKLDWPCDLLVGYMARNILLEVKVPGKENRKDQWQQAEWRKDWPGQIQVVTTPEQAVYCVTNCYREERD